MTHTRSSLTSALAFLILASPLSAYAEIRLICKSSGSWANNGVVKSIVLVGHDEPLREVAGKFVTETWAEEEVTLLETTELSPEYKTHEFYNINRTTLSGSYSFGPAPGSKNTGIEPQWMPIQCKKTERQI